MFYIYSKEKKTKLAFTVNLTAEEVKNFMGNNLFLDYPELNKNDYLVIERNEAFKHPTYDIVTNTIREMTREELIEEEIEVQLSPGEYIENKINELEKIRDESLKEYQEKFEKGIEDETLWQYISTKKVEIHTLKDILKD